MALAESGRSFILYSIEKTPQKNIRRFFLCRCRSFKKSLYCSENKETGKSSSRLADSGGDDQI